MLRYIYEPFQVTNQLIENNTFKGFSKNSISNSSLLSRAKKAFLEGSTINYLSSLL